MNIDLNIDTELQQIFGLTKRETQKYSRSPQVLPSSFFHTFVNLIDHSGAIEYIEERQAKQRKSAAGRKSIIPLRAVFVVMLMNNFWGLGSSYIEVAETFLNRMSAEQRRLLGINVQDPEKVDWYNAAHRAMRRGLKAIDPWYLTTRRHTLNKAEYDEAQRLKDKSRQREANDVLAMLIHASVKTLPEKFLDGYSGDLALDATLIPVGSRPNSPKKGLFLNVDFTGGIYGRSHGHYAKFAFGYEAETTVMVDAKHGQFPFPLITGAYLHRPARIKRGASAAIRGHHALFPTPGTVLVDRAYNNLKTHRFQMLVRTLRYWTAYKYPMNRLGLQGKVTGHPVIMVDGNLYLETMPKHLQQLHYLRTNRLPMENGNHITDELYRQYFIQRSRYRLSPHGRPDEDGYARYTMPENIDRLDHRDPATGAPCNAPKITAKRITVAPEPHIIRHLQKAEYLSAEWKQLTGQRNHVENSNRSIKRSNGVDLHNSSKRLGRGRTFQTLAVAFAIAAENIRRIITGIGKFCTASIPKPAPKTRAKRRGQFGAACTSGNRQAQAPPKR